MSLKTKAKWFFSFLSLGLIFATVFINMHLQSIKTEWNSFQSIQMSKMQSISAIKSFFGYGGGIHHFKNYVIRGGDKYYERFIKSWQGVEEHIAYYKSIPGVSNEELALLDKMTGPMQAYRDHLDIVRQKKQEGLGVKEIDGIVKISDGPALEAIAALQKSVATAVSAGQANLSAQIRLLQLVMLAVGGIGFMGAIFAAWLFLRVVLRPISKAAVVMKQVQDGDLDVHMKVKRTDELGQMARSIEEAVRSLEQKAEQAQLISEGDLRVDVDLASDKDAFGIAFKEMVHKLNFLLTKIKDTAATLHIAADKSAHSSNVLHDGAAQQAASTSEIASTMTDLVQQVKATAEQANGAHQDARKSAEITEAGAREMGTLVSGMESVNQSSQEVSRIIRVIDDIAFQTNLLALNAAVEASRAGEHGKGFAVVAEEVRTLAGRSAEAAQETTNMVEKSVQEVNSLMKTVHIFADQLKSIHSQVDELAGVVGNIAEVSTVQSQSLEEVGEALQQIDEVIQNTMSEAESNAREAGFLKDEVMALEEMVADYKVKGDDSSGSMASSIGVSPAGLIGYS